MASNAVNCETLSQLLLRSFGAITSRKLNRADLELANDNELVVLTLRGDSRSYEFLVRRYQKLVFNVVFQMLHNHESASDVTQDTFLKAFRALSTFRTDAKFKPWLLRIATNTALNKIRDAKQHEHDSLDVMLEDKSAPEPASDEDVAMNVEWRLSQTLIADALRKVPVRHRHIFLLRYQHDLTYAEIASVTDETEATVKSLLFRTREKLRKLLEDEMKK